MANHPLTPQLAALRLELEVSARHMHRLTDRVDEATWGRSPGRGRWSIARCIEHLNLTSRAYLPVLRAAFRDARVRGLVANEPINRMDFWGWLIFQSSGDRTLFKMKTPDPFIPPTIEPKENVTREFDELQDELIALLDEYGDLPLSQITITSPFNAKIKYNAYSAYRLIPAHQRRHLAQAEHVSTALASRFVKL